MVLDSFSSDGSRERSKLVEEQVSPPEQRRWSFLPFPFQRPAALFPFEGWLSGIGFPPYRDGSVSGPDAREATVRHPRSAAGRYDPPRRLS